MTFSVKAGEFLSLVVNFVLSHSRDSCSLFISSMFDFDPVESSVSDPVNVCKRY